WFADRQALDFFVRFNFNENVRLNAYWFSPLPKIVANVLHSSGLVISGAAGFAQACASVRRRPDERVVLVATAAGLLLGLGLMGRAYEQYFVMFFPHFAVFGGSFVVEQARRLTPPPDRYRAPCRAALFVVPIACLIALVIFSPEWATGKGFTMVAL